MQLTSEGIEILLLIAALVAMLSQRVRLPYSMGLVAVGIILGWLAFVPQIDLSRELLVTILLPPELEQREHILTAAFGVVAISIFVQGLTITPLLRRLQVLQPPSTINTNTEELADRP